MQAGRGVTRSKWFDISLEQRLTYLTAKVGEAATEVLKLSRGGNGDIGKMSAADMAGVDLERVFAKKALGNMARQWRRSA